jgi:hypothetical protein
MIAVASVGVALLRVGEPAPTHVHTHEHAHEHDGELHAHPHSHQAANVQHHEHAHEEDSVPPKPWRVGAIVDVLYSVNSNFPANHVYRGRSTTPRTGELTLDYVAAYLLHTPRRAAPFRFELALHAGSNVEATYASEPQQRYAGAETFKHVGLANAGLVAPWGHERGFTTETGAGVFSSPIGLGGFRSMDNWNYTSAWGNEATPYYLMGAHVTQTLARRVKIGAWVVNGWQTIADANVVPSYLGFLTAEPIDGLRITQTVFFGPEHGDISPAAWRVHSDTQLSFERPAGGVGLFAEYGQERRTDLPASPIQRWAGGAVLSRWRVHGFAHGSWDMGLRPELWWDPDGTFFGIPQALISASYTNSLRLFDHALARIEYRYDRTLARDGYFYAGESIEDTDILAVDQHTVFFSLVGYFEHAFSGRRASAASR